MMEPVSTEKSEHKTAMADFSQEYANAKVDDGI